MPTPQIMVGVDTVLIPNTVYALPASSSQISWQKSSTGVALQLSIDGINFWSTAVTQPGEVRTISVCAIFVKVNTGQVHVVAKAVVAALGLPSTIVVDTILVSDGSVTNPSFGFQNEPDLGFFRPEPGKIEATKNFGVLGQTFSSDGTVAAPGFAFQSERFTGLFRIAPQFIGIATGGVTRASFIPVGLKFPDTGSINWAPSVTDPTDLTLLRDGPNILAQKNGANDQEFRIYGSISTIYGRFVQSGATLYIRPSGSGSSLSLGNNDTACWQIIGPTGNLLPQYNIGDNIQDIGALTNRVKDLYLGTSLSLGLPSGGSNLIPDGLNVIAMKNGANVQTLKIYGPGGVFGQIQCDGNFAINQPFGAILGLGNDVGGSTWLLAIKTLYPNSDNLADIGDTSHRIRNCYLGTGLVLGMANPVTIKPGSSAAPWSMTLPTGPGTLNQVLSTDGTGITFWATVTGGGGGTGDVSGPSSAVDNSVAVFNGTTGKLIKDASEWIIDPTTFALYPLNTGTQDLGKTTNVVKTGYFGTGLFGDGTAAAPSIAFTSEPNTGIYRRTSPYIMFAITGAEVGYMSIGGWTIGSTGGHAFLGFAGDFTTLAGADVFLQRDAANVLALKNGANAQTFRIYGNATNYAQLQHDGINLGLITNAGHVVLQPQNTFAVFTYGSLLSGSDNGFDVGGTGQRFRNLYLGTALAIGTNPATTGAIRLANNASIGWRNTANTADVNLLVGGDDNFYFQSSVTHSVLGVSDNSMNLGHPSLRWANLFLGTALAIGTNPAASGAIRLANNLSIEQRNGTNTADIELLRLDPNNNIAFGGGANFIQVLAGTIYPVSDNTVDCGLNVGRWRNLWVGTSINVGTNPATSGAIRLANTTAINWRNAANTADIQAVIVDSTDNLELGGTTAITFLTAATSRWQITNTGLIPTIDNTYDIGASDSANRPRNIFAGTAVSASGGKLVIAGQSGGGSIYFSNPLAAVNQKNWTISQSPDTSLYVFADDDSFASLATPITMRRTGDVLIGRDIYEKARTTPVGHWIPVPFSASNFSAVGAGNSWTVTAAAITDNQYMLIGNTMFWSFYISWFAGAGTNVIGGAPTQITMVPPVAITANLNSAKRVGQLVNNGAVVGGVMAISNVLSISIDGGVAFAGSAGVIGYVMMRIA